MEEERRPGGPGLGGAAAMWTMAETVGQSPPRQADSALTTVGGGRAWVVMQLTSFRGKPDTPSHPHPLMLRLPSIIDIRIWRREDASAMMTLTLPLLISIAQEEEEV